MSIFKTVEISGFFKFKMEVPDDGSGILSEDNAIEIAKDKLFSNNDCHFEIQEIEIY